MFFQPLVVIVLWLIITKQTSCAAVSALRLCKLRREAAPGYYWSVSDNYWQQRYRRSRMYAEGTAAAFYAAILLNLHPDITGWRKERILFLLVSYACYRFFRRESKELRSTL
jgi:hypothetical protein